MFTPKVKLTSLNELTVESYIEITQELARIDREHIEEELVSFAAIFSYYYGLMVRAKRDLDTATYNIETLKSCYKNDILKLGKLSVDALNNRVNCLDDVKEQSNTVFKQEETYGLMKAICTTLEHKKDMLIQISANRRQEIKLH